jgi:hypothetical protein
VCPQRSQRDLVRLGGRGVRSASEAATRRKKRPRCLYLLFLAPASPKCKGAGGSTLGGANSSLARLFGLALIDTMGTSYGRLRRFPIAWGYLPEALPVGETGGTGLMLGTCLVGPVLLAWFLDVATLLLSCYSVPAEKGERLSLAALFFPFISAQLLRVEQLTCMDASALTCRASWM